MRKSKKRTNAKSVKTETLNPAELSHVSGGQSPNVAVVDAINKTWGSQGAVSLVGKPQVGPAKNGVEQVSGKFDVNSLSGGTQRRSFTGSYDVGSNTFSDWRSKPLGYPN
jgi:hypothetical protein